MTMMRIAEVAERTGVPATTLRYYEEIGLLAPAVRSDNGYREYAARDLERLAFITRAKQLDIRLDELRELVDVWDTDDCSQVQHRMAAVVSSRVAETQGRIVELVELAAQLESAAARLTAAPAAPGGCDADCACMSATSGSPAAQELPIPRVRLSADDPAVACTLDAGQMSGRMSDWQAALAKATAREETADGIALTFAHDVALTAELARLAAAEFACCSFFRFTLAVDTAGVRLDVGAPPEARGVVTAVFGAAA